MTLSGTNSYVVEVERQAFVVDPGPADPGHLGRVRERAEERGGLSGVLLTHGHGDHAEGAGSLGGAILWPVPADDAPGPVAGTARAPGNADASGKLSPADASVGPFDVVPTPGHSPDHVVFMLDRVCFCGDLVLGEGSTFVPPDGGSLVAYLDSLHRLRALEPELLCPGHGPWITEPRAKIDEYIEHRLERERKLVEALEGGERSRARLLDAAWDDVPAELRGAAAVVMQAHLEKLDSEGRFAPDELTD